MGIPTAIQDPTETSAARFAAMRWLSLEDLGVTVPSALLAAADLWSNILLTRSVIARAQAS